MKERINTAFETFLRLHEETINRDSVIVESLLDTQLGKLRRLIVRKNTHEDLKIFADDLNEDFEWPDILLSTKPPAAWRQMESAPLSQATRTSSAARKKMNSTLQAHTRITSIGRRSGAGRGPTASGSRSSHSRNSSHNKRSRRGSAKRRQQPRDRPYQTATEEDDAQNNSDCLIAEVELTEEGEGVENETTLEVDVVEDENRKRRSRRSDKYKSQEEYRQRGKRNPRVEAYARNVEAYGGQHGSRRSSFRRRGRSSSSRAGRDDRLGTRSSHRSGRSTSERGRSSRSERASRSRSAHSRRGNKALARGAQPQGNGYSNQDLPESTRNEKFHSFGYQQEEEGRAGNTGLYDSKNRGQERRPPRGKGRSKHKHHRRGEVPDEAEPSADDFEDAGLEEEDAGSRKQKPQRSHKSQKQAGPHHHSVSQGVGSGRGE